MAIKFFHVVANITTDCKLTHCKCTCDFTLNLKFSKVCRRSWLGLWNSPNPPEPESRDEIKVKDFMMQKYDRKTWYIPPSQLPPASPKRETSQPLPERKPLKQLLGEGSPTLVVGHEVQCTFRNMAWRGGGGLVVGLQHMTTFLLLEVSDL